MSLRIESLRQGYGDAAVLKDVSLIVEKGEVVCVLGPNGSGKSTLIKTICNILPPKGGSISVDGLDTSDIEPKELSRYIGYVPQKYASSDYMKVFDAVLLGRAPYMSWSYSKNDFRMAAKAIHDMGIFDLIDRDINDLSGGQMQKVIIARAMAQAPEYYILDEPTSSLDLRNQLDTLHTVKNMVREGDCGALVALHDLNLAMRYCDRVVMIHDGYIHVEGRPEEVITERNILEVYGVHSEILEGREGRIVNICEGPGH